MPKILNSKSLYYDDVNLIAAEGIMASRKEMPRELHRIIVSPMAAIIGKTFAIEAVNLGLSLVLHRFCTISEQLELYQALPSTANVWCAIGLKEIERLEILYQAGCRKFLLDVANGHSRFVVNFADTFTRDYSDCEFMTGNVHTANGFNNLSLHIHSEKQNAIRVGIGNGAVCLTTKEATGFGRGQLTEIMDCYENRINPQTFIIADGGIKTPADAAKAFGAGSDMIMLGSYFSKAQEAETHQIGDHTYWGGASQKQQELYGQKKEIYHSEGCVLPIQKQELKPLKVLAENLWSSLASAVSYSGNKSLTDFIGKGTFEIKFNN